MASALPFRPSIDHTPTAESAVGLASDDADRVLDALGSETARALLTALADAPATASELADVTDTSLQNAQYHLDNLRDADLVTAVGTWYSAKGKEMTVYAPTTERIRLRLGPATPPGGEEPRPDTSSTGIEHRGE